MHLKPIRTEAEHAEALADIERLWDAPEGSFDDSLLGPYGVSPALDVLPGVDDCHPGRFIGRCVA
jgi:hypothetical protein